MLVTGLPPPASGDPASLLGEAVPGLRTRHGRDALLGLLPLPPGLAIDFFRFCRAIPPLDALLSVPRDTVSRWPCP